MEQRQAAYECSNETSECPQLQSRSLVGVSDSFHAQTQICGDVDRNDSKRSVYERACVSQSYTELFYITLLFHFQLLYIFHYSFFVCKYLAPAPHFQYYSFSYINLLSYYFIAFYYIILIYNFFRNPCHFFFLIHICSILVSVF